MKRLTAYILLYNFIGLSIAICGWIWEVLIFFVKDRCFVNRGFLYGPYLPVYGAGAILLSILFYYKDIAVIVTYARFSGTHVPKEFYHSNFYSRFQLLIQKTIRQRAYVLPPFKRKDPLIQCRDHLFLRRSESAGCSCFEKSMRRVKQFHMSEDIRIFLISLSGGSLTELVTGWFLWHVFHRKYWDYSGFPLNLGGYICIFSALGFGIFGVLWMKWISPPLIRLWEKISFSIQILIIGLSDMIVITDAIFSFIKPNSGENITFSFLTLLKY